MLNNERERGVGDLKHNEKKNRFRKQRSVQSVSPIAEPGLTLREFWAELQRAKAAGEPLPAVGSRPPQDALSRWSSGSFRSSGSGSGSGSGSAGYGLALISSDPESQERIRRIMRSLCEKDAKRHT